MAPKISVITVVRNNRDTILDTLESVRSQVYEPVEHIVIDGASTDGTRELLEANRAHIATLISERDSGIYDAMNKGLSHSTGDIIGFLNADDMFRDPHVLSDLAKVFADEAPDLVYGDVVYVRPQEKSRVVRHYSARGFHPGWLAFGLAPPHPSLYAQRALYERFGPMKADYAIAADFEFVARIFRAGHVKTRYLDRIFVTMRLGGASTSGLRSILINNREILRACRENNIPSNYMMLYLKYLTRLFELRPGL